MYEFIAELCLIVGNTAFQTCSDLFTCALCDDPFLLQVWHRLDPAGLWMHVFFRDQGGRILVPNPRIRSCDPCQLDSIACHSWNHDTAHFSFCRLWLLSVYIRWSEYIWWETLRILVFPGLGHTNWSSRLQLMELLSLTLNSADRLIALWHRYGDTIRLFLMSTGYLKCG